MKTRTYLAKLALVVLFAFCVQGVLAQNPDFTYKLGGKITYRKLTDAGVLVVANGDGLVGIKPGASEPHFNFKDYGRVKPDELEFVPMSPYLVVSQGGFMTAKKSVIDFVSGKKMFGTEENGWKLTNRCDVMLPQNKLVVLGSRKSGAMAVGLYDLATGKEEGLVELNDPKKVGFASAIPQFSGRPAIIGDGLIVPTTKNLMQIDVKSGKTAWTTKVDDITWLTADATGNEIYAFEQTQGGDTKIYKVKNDGTILWEKGVKVKGKVSRFEILPQGLAIVSDVDNSGKSGLAKLASAASESKIGFLNAKDGSDLWEKAPKTKGYVQHFYVMSDGILFGIQEGGINKISFDGTTLFKKPLKTGENIHTMALTPKGLIYITDTDADIINLSSGESIWNKPIKYKKASAVASTYDARNKRYLISTGEEMVAINETSGDISTLAKYKFEEKEVPGTLKVRDGGLLLTSDQNVMMLNFDGSKKFHEYYRSPGKSTAGGILAGVMGVASMAMSSAAAYQGGRYGTYAGSNMLNSYGEQMKVYQEGFANIASASFAEMNKRFKATSATENYQFILTKLEDGVGLAKVSKDTGKKDKEIVLKDKKPEYEVDEFGGFLYYQKDGSTLYAFDLKK
ncbi:MAG: PQQ-binding-like beta-propeller repeat protein [Pedobacter sp.]|uniref:outer membrane protein assembly factor BamB family protein n=1 Tax=Pedobacter sp. TaxID=1411316 RepID=UPI002809323F|nr:PQQ-binding-like beta-propeller repeat protein [Pedobacter sp.]MDQ8003822.1 PQQ-binding-like beta-propeller repeat protein [Pedobacter sp.]